MAEKTNETVKTRGQVISELETQGKLTAEEVAKLTDEENPIDVLTIGGIEIDFSELGAAGKTLVGAFKLGEIKIGDYISYTPSNTTASATVGKQETGVDESQTYTVDTSMSWRVLGLSEDENQLLITTESPIKRDGEDPYLSLKGAESYYNCVGTLNKICKIYENSQFASETRSIKIEDINNALGIVKEGNIIYKDTDSAKTNLDIIKELGNVSTYVSNRYGLMKYMKDIYNLDVQEEKVGDTVKATAYQYRYTSDDIISSTSKLYEILFSGTLSSDNLSKTYWLASPGVLTNGGNSACFGPGRVNGGAMSAGSTFYISSGEWYWCKHAVRPIVELKPNITINQLSISNSGTQADWTGVTGAGTVANGSLTGEAGKIN